MRLPSGLNRPAYARPDHDPDVVQASLVEHLEELRDRIVRSLLFIAVAWVAGWFLVPVFYGLINQVAQRSVVPNLPKGVEFKEVFSEATGPFVLQMKMSFSIGLFFAIPFVVRQIWGFVAPGLRPQEQEPFRKLAPWSIVLFLFGAGIAWIVLPPALIWLTGFMAMYPGADLFQGAGSLGYFFIKMMTAFGIAFQLPLIVYALGSIGLLTSQTLIKHWRHAATFIFIASAVITPSADPFSMLMMAVPMCLLFMGSVYAVKVVQGKREAQEAAEEAERNRLDNAGPILRVPEESIPRTSTTGLPEEANLPRDES